MSQARYALEMSPRVKQRFSPMRRVQFSVFSLKMNSSTGNFFDLYFFSRQVKRIV